MRYLILVPVLALTSCSATRELTDEQATAIVEAVSTGATLGVESEEFSPEVAQSAIGTASDLARALAGDQYAPIVDLATQILSGLVLLWGTKKGIDKVRASKPGALVGDTNA